MKTFVATLLLFVSHAAATSYAAYDFLTITGNNLGGNAAVSQFQSLNGHGVINVSHSYTSGSPAPSDNVNSAIFPSQFQALFPGTGQVQGHLAQTNVNSISTITFDLTGYSLSAQTVFGIWNIIDESLGQPHYRVELVDAMNLPQPPATFNLIGKQDNETQVAGRRRLDLDVTTGNLTATALINAGGTHSNAAFWDNIPLGTKQIIVYGNLPNLSTGDGVGYYFAEIHVPEPTGTLLALAGLTGLAMVRRRA
jgi:MYXO-CTERM domain-containing protein